MEITSNDLARLEAIAAFQYPIPDNLCPFKKQGLKYKRTAFVWRMKKEFLLLSVVQKDLVLNELERKIAG